MNLLLQTKSQYKMNVVTKLHRQELTAQFLVFECPYNNNNNNNNNNKGVGHNIATFFKAPPLSLKIFSLCAWNGSTGSFPTHVLVSLCNALGI